MKQTGTVIARHKTAIRRPSFSLPIKCLLRDGLLDPTGTLFDYGCGHGQDLKLLADMNIPCGGWDPVFRPDAEKQRADVVNLGYVINVIEDLRQRSATLRDCLGPLRELVGRGGAAHIRGPTERTPRIR